MKKILSVIALILSVAILTACGSKNKLIGSWEGKTTDGLKTTLTFEKKDVVKYENEYGFKGEGTYKIDGDKVTISLDIWEKDKVYTFSVEDKKLDLTATDQYSPSYKGMTLKK